MPTYPAKARHLLEKGKAKVVKRTPFTIQLTYPTGEAKQPITLGVDAGSKHIGMSASTEKAELFACEVELRQDISKNIAERKEHRVVRRSRKTRHRKPRFDNRVHAKKKGSLAPSIENRIEAHMSRIKKVCKILPVTKLVVETAPFDTQLLKNPEIKGVEYQQGEQLGFWNVREYVLYRDNHECQHCHGKSKCEVLEVHHIESRQTGGNAPNNLITLCKDCHQALHQDKIKLKAKRGQSFKDAAFMSIMGNILLERLRQAYPELEISYTYGYLTKHKRISLGLPKSHCNDAYCIAGNLEAKRSDVVFYQKQTRKHNRQIHKCTILKGGYRKRNQAPYEIHGYRLFDKVLCNGVVCFIFGRRKTGSFDVRKLNGERVSVGISYKKLRLLEKRKTYLIEIRKREDGNSSPS